MVLQFILIALLCNAVHAIPLNPVNVKCNTVNRPGPWENYLYDREFILERPMQVGDEIGILVHTEDQDWYSINLLDKVQGESKDYEDITLHIQNRLFWIVKSQSVINSRNAFKWGKHRMNDWENRKGWSVPFVIRKRATSFEIETESYIVDYDFYHLAEGNSEVRSVIIDGIKPHEFSFICNGWDYHKK